MTGWRGGAKADMNKDVTATNVTHVTSDPFYAVTASSRRTRWRRSASTGAPTGTPRSTSSRRAAEHLRSGQAGRAGGQIHAKAVDDAAMIWVYHDTTPRALSSRIKTYVQAQSWFQDRSLVDNPSCRRTGARLQCGFNRN